MKIGYLHLDNNPLEQSGVTRYGCQLAAEAKTRPAITVQEAYITLSSKVSRNWQQISQAIQTLESTDLVHLNYSKYAWGDRWQLSYLGRFLLQYSKPVIVTLHDVYPEIYPRDKFFNIVQQKYQRQASASSNFWQRGIKTIKAVGDYTLDNTSLKFLLKRANFIVVNNQVEYKIVKPLINFKKLKNINLYVPAKKLNINSNQARKMLSLESYRLLTLQGFIYRGKGHQLVIDALPYLPEDVKVVFAGAPAKNNEQYYQNLINQVEKQGLEYKLIITGYLPQEELEKYLIATHLAICPFQKMSASASLTTWIAMGRPILASDLPQIQEYNQLEPGAIKTFSHYNVKAFIEAIEELLPNCQEEEDPRIVKLRERLSLSKIFDQYQELYQQLI